MREDSLSAFEALSVMKQSMVLRAVEKRILFAWDGNRILLSSDNLSARLSEEDFLELYGHFSFAPVKETGAIDAKKDEEYYAWRAVKQ